MNMLETLPLTGLEEGEFTEITPRVRELAEKIDRYEPTRNMSVPEKVSHYIHHQIMARNSLLVSNDERRKRSGDEILRPPRYAYSCNDRAIAFLVLNRALGQPALYVETLNENTAREGKINDGHIFADVLLEGIWTPYNPGKLGPLMNYNIKGDRFIAGLRGVDFSQLYVLDTKTGLYHEESVRVQTEEERKVIARKFFGFKLQ